MTTDRDIEISYSLPEFISELRRLADALESRELFDLDGEQITIPDDAVFAVEHEREDGIEEISFELRWDALDEDDEDEDDGEEDEDGEDENEEADSEADEAPTSAPA